MEILQTVPQILETFSDEQFDLTAWRRYAACVHPNLPQKCEDDIQARFQKQGYGFETDVQPILEDCLRHPAALQEIGAVFDAVALTLQQNLTCLFDAEPDIMILLYLGLCNGAGWATTLGGKDAVLIGIEKLYELQWTSREDLQGLLFHEIGHLWHKAYRAPRPKWQSRRRKAVLQVYDEGIAMVCEQLLADDETFFHQNKYGWLTWCTAHDAEIKQEYLLRLRRQKSVQDFFGDWVTFQGKSDVGYYLGCRFVRSLLRDMTLPQAAALPYPKLQNKLYEFLKAGT